MAEEPAQGRLHEVGDVEADGVIEAASHGLLHNEAIGRVVRNMYKRIQVLEEEVKDLKSKKTKKPLSESGGP